MGMRRPGPLQGHGHVDHAAAPAHVVHHKPRGHHGHGGQHAHEKSPLAPGPLGSEPEPFIKDKTLRVYVEMRPLPGGVNADLLKQAIRGVGAAANDWVDPLNAACKKYEISKSLRRMAAFLGHITHESGALHHFKENLNYGDAEKLKKLFGAFKSVDEAKGFLHKPEAIANKAYANRNGNGDEASGDGWRYRGRGLIQLTGKSNYAAFAKECGVDVVKDPDLVATPQYAALSAGFFWKKHGLNELADSELYQALSKRINKSLKSFPTREENRRRAMAALCRAVTADLAISLVSGAFWAL